MVLSCSVMDSGICLRNPSLPFSSIPTCAVICNIWRYQPEMGGTENCSQSWDTLKELLAGEESHGSAFPLALSVLTPFAALISLGGERGQNPVLLDYMNHWQAVLLNFLHPLKKWSSLWLLDFTDNPLCHQQAAKQLACTVNESCTLV